MPRIYVGTYGKYNAGSIAGAWLDLEDYDSRDDFLKACAELHSDESDPEFMFQDFEGFPKELYSESSIPESLWDWLDLDEDDRELLAVYRADCDREATIEDARDAFLGRYESQSDWAAEYLEESGVLESVPESLRGYIDFEAYARDARLGGDVTFVLYEGKYWVFSNH